MMTSTMRKRVFADTTLAVFLAIGAAAAWAVSGLSADEGGKPSSDLPSAIEDTWTSDPESMLRRARARLGIGEEALSPFSPLALNPVVPDGQVGEFRHGTWPSLGVGDGNWTHTGVDLTAPCGSRILAFADGTVVDRIVGHGEPGFDTLGHMVLIEHPETLLGRGFRTLYVHLQEPPRVAVGDKVEGGRTVIGRVGATGAALGCHLHFEARFFPGRFHPDWDSIYGRGDRRSSEELHRDWIDPELLFRAFPEGLKAPAAVATGSRAGSPATTTTAARESSGPAVDSGASAEDLILALEELHRAINAKIDRDLDTIAFAYWSAFEIRRAGRLADWIMAPVHIIKAALDVQLFTQGPSGIQTRIKQAKSTLELAALTTGFVQANTAVSRLLLGGPELGDALDAMITSASAHPRDAQAFQTTIRYHLEDPAKSPIALATPGAPDAQGLVRGIREVRRALAAELAQLKADLAASPPDPAAAERAARSVRELTQVVKRSGGTPQEVRLPAAGDAGANGLSLGAVMELNRAWTDALGNYDRDMKIEQIVSVISITSLGVSYVTISTSPLDATGAAIRVANRVATAVDLGSFAFEHTFTTNAREQVNTLPHEMVLTLAPELANLWRLVRGVESTVRGQREAERPAEPVLVAGTPEPTAGASADAPGDQVEITMGDGSMLRGQLEAAKVPFVSGYGTIEVATSAITIFADGRLVLEDGSVLKGAFGDGDLALATSQGVLRVPAREIVAMTRNGESKPVAEESQPKTPAPAVAQDQAVLVGRVLDRFKKPVSGATVRVLGSNLRTTTDSSGNYRLPYAPGKFLLGIEKPGYDSEQFDLELTQSATFPVEDKFLTRVPSVPGLYFWGKADWLATSPCRIESQVESHSRGIHETATDRFVALGSPSVIVHDGSPHFLDLTGAREGEKNREWTVALHLLPVAADGAILRSVREASFFGGIRPHLEDELAKAEVPLKWGQIGRKRQVFWADLKPGVYALVSVRSLFGPGPFAELGPTCYMFELATAAQVEEARRVQEWFAELERRVAAHEKGPWEATWPALRDHLSQWQALLGTERVAAMVQRDRSIDALLTRLDDAINAPARSAAQAGEWQAVETWADRVLALFPYDTEPRSQKEQAVAALRGPSSRTQTRLRVEPGQTTAWIQVPHGSCANWNSDGASVWIATQERKVLLFKPGIPFTHIAFTAPENHPVNVRYYIDYAGNCSDPVP